MTISKKTNRFLILFLFVLQVNLSAQKTKAILVFNDGTTKTGLGKLSGIDKIKFKTSKKDKATKYHFSDLHKVIIEEDNEASTYKYIKVDIETYKVLKELTTGKVNLYTMEITGYAGGHQMPGAHGGGMWFPESTYNIKNLFVLREGEEMAIHLGSNLVFSKNFKKAASEFFKDCPKLVQKINDKVYKRRDIKDVVIFYNSQCDSKDAK